MTAQKWPAERWAGRHRIASRVAVFVTVTVPESTATAETVDCSPSSLTPQEDRCLRKSAVSADGVVN
jgi:hypothetical protein